MLRIVDDIDQLLSETAGLPPFNRDDSGQVVGWPAHVVAHLRDVVSTMVHCSNQELCEAILKIEQSDHKRVPDGLLTLLSRAAWDAPAAPDAVKVLRACQQGLSLRNALGLGGISDCAPQPDKRTSGE